MSEEEIKNAPGGEAGDNPGGEAGNGKPTDDGGGKPTEYEINGQKYTSEQIQEAMKYSDDYQHLVPEFTKKSQALAEYEKLGKLDDIKKILETPSNGNSQISEAKKILKEQLGVVTKEDMEEALKDIKEFKKIQTETQEKLQLDAATKTLSEKYGGKKGEPAFKIEQIAKAVKENPALAVYVQANGQYLIDLEQTYKKIYADFWDKIPEFKAKVLKTERGSQVQTKTPSKEKKAETEEERVQSAIDFFKASAQSE